MEMLTSMQNSPQLVPVFGRLALGICSALLCAAPIRVNAQDVQNVSPYNDWSNDNVRVSVVVGSTGRKILPQPKPNKKKPVPGTLIQLEKNIDVTVDALHSLGNPRIECYFSVHTLGHPSHLVAAQRSSKAPDGGSRFSITTQMREIQVGTFVPSYADMGNSIDGWMVRVIANGTVVGVAASNDEYLAAAKDPQHLQDALASTQ
jgi:hypothetical protein